MRSKRERAAYKSGAAAYYDGKPRTMNPWADDLQLFKAWFMGWTDASKGQA